MAGKYVCIALLVFLQTSLVLCRSTLSPIEPEKGATEKSTNEKFPSIVENSPIQHGVIPGKMNSDDNFEATYYDALARTYTIVAILMAVFAFLSFSLGCIIYFCCKKDPIRPGFVVNSNTEGQTGGIQQPGVPGTIQPMQAYPPNTQQQNMYPAVYPTK